MAKATTPTTTKTKRVAQLVVTAPGGPRRRAGFSFGPAETVFTEEQLGEDGAKLIEAWRADPMLKIDSREVEVPDAEDPSQPE